MRVQPAYYRGISFVRLSDLPVEQQIALRLSPHHPERIKILIDGKIVDECIQYAAYSEWFTSVYKVAQVEGTYSTRKPEMSSATALVHKSN